MAKLSREGHRKRLRARYIRFGPKAFAEDTKLLELFLTTVIPRKDVRPLAYTLIDTFGSLENVMNAKHEELLQVKGVGESTATLINLVTEINFRLDERRSRLAKVILTNSQVRKYCEDVFQDCQNEKLVVVTICGEKEIFRCHTIVEGVIDFDAIPPRAIVECAIFDKASSIIIAHNHKCDESQKPSENLLYKISITGFLNQVGIKIRNFIVIDK
jgi:DNA repair protein RadC